jgi:sialate O-acetylesterase
MLPFLIVQLPLWGPVSANSQRPAPWAVVQEAQRKVAAETNNTGLAVTIDVGNALNIHPTDKHTVGRRLAAGGLKNWFTILRGGCGRPGLPIV